MAWPLALLLLAPGLQAPGAAQPRRPFVENALQRLELTVGGGLRATVSPATGLVTFLSFAPQREALVRLPADAPAEQRALAFLDEHGAAFGVLARESVAVTRVSPPDELGIEHVRLRQVHRGVPVTGGELIVHLRDAAVLAVNGKTLGDLDRVETVPGVDALEAMVSAQRVLEGRLGVTGAALSEPRLELFNRGLLEGRPGPTRLTWFVEARAPALREWLWVDAESGAPLLHFSQLPDARDREVYDADDPGDGVFDDLPGTLVRGETDPATGDADVDAAWDHSGHTYDYFWTQHGRDSYDDAGATLVSTVHYCPSAASCPYGNAFWDGTQMVFGNGYAGADDVVAHELTHAVSESTANFFYYMQSGALSESYSDIFGETVDLLNGTGTDTAQARWKIGEDTPIGAIRDMSNPKTNGDPGKTSDAQFVCSDNAIDNGGVHTNSGVPNHAYALMVDGGSFNGEAVTALGLIKAGKIQYRALSTYLTSASGFLDNRDALVQACRDLVGVAGITPGDCVEVEDALAAVEMASPWPCAPAAAAVPAFCPGGEAPTLVHALDFETLDFTPCPTDDLFTGWCLNRADSVLGPFATSGTNSLWAYNLPTAASYWVTITPGGLATLPAGAILQFNHSHGFENSGSTYWDGGQIHYSTDNGASFVDGGPLITAGQAYGGALDTGFSNPLGGESAFVADSWGYTATQLDLSSLAGLPFRYRFLVGTDSLIDDWGWFVDDVRIFSCAACVSDRVLTAPYNGLASFYGASLSVEARDGFRVGAMESVTIQAPEVRLGNGFEAGGDLTIANGSCP